MISRRSQVEIIMSRPDWDGVYDAHASNIGNLDALSREHIESDLNAAVLRGDIESALVLEQHLLDRMTKAELEHNNAMWTMATAAIGAYKPKGERQLRLVVEAIVDLSERIRVGFPINP